MFENHRIMRKMAFPAAILLLLLFVCSFSIAQKKSYESDYAKDWKLVFSDEFDKTDGSQPDSSIWQRCVRRKARWDRWISNSKSVVYIKDGKLVCRAIPNGEAKRDTAQMLTGAVDTRSTVSFQYGKIEVRMRTNAKPGNFPAIWLLPKQPAAPHPFSGEIDIVEFYGLQPDAYHTAHTNWTLNLKQTDNPPHQFHEKVSPTEWHVYGLVWDKKHLAWYVDGKFVGAYKRKKTKKARKGGQWPFDHPFYVVLNQSVGDGTWRRYGAKEPILTDTYETEIDYVRIYKREK